jgi:NTE family protein
MTYESNNTAGLVLSGGGAFGAYEVGVIKALYSGKSPATAGVPLDAGVFAGTSVGSLNAAILAMNKGGAEASAKRLHDIWIHHVADNGDGRGNGVYRVRGHAGNYLDVRHPGSPLEQLTRMFGDALTFGDVAARNVLRTIPGSGTPLSLLTGMIDLSVMLNTRPFEELVKRWIDPGTLRESTKELSVQATNWNLGDPEDFDFREMNDQETWDALRASAAIPGLFPAVTMRGQIFLDGGVAANTPIQPAVKAGATELHVISLNPEVPAEYTGATGDIFNRVFMAMVAANISEDIKSAEWINKGIEIIERIDASESEEDALEKIDGADAERFIRAAGIIQRALKADGVLPRKLTIHRYFPTTALGGAADMLNFDRSAIDGLIQRGYDDACAHKCKDGDRDICLIPKTSTNAGKS